MKTNAEQNTKETHFAQSTYAMVLRSQDRRRNILEIVVYSCLMVSLLLASLLPLTPLIRSADHAKKQPIVATAASL